MTITEFAKLRHIQPQAVQRYLSRHKELKDKCIKRGKSVEIPADVEAELDKKYPLDHSIMEYRDHPETLAALKQAKEDLDKKTVEMDALQKDFNAAQTELKAALVEVINLKNRIEEQDKQILLIEQKDTKIAALEAELQAEKNKTWWQKLFKR